MGWDPSPRLNYPFSGWVKNDDDDVMEDLSLVECCCGGCGNLTLPLPLTLFHPSPFPYAMLQLGRRIKERKEGDHHDEEQLQLKAIQKRGNALSSVGDMTGHDGEKRENKQETETRTWRDKRVQSIFQWEMGICEISFISSLQPKRK